MKEIKIKRKRATILESREKIHYPCICFKHCNIFINRPKQSSNLMIKALYNHKKNKKIKGEECIQEVSLPKEVFFANIYIFGKNYFIHILFQLNFIYLLNSDESQKLLK